MANWHGISTFDPLDRDSFNNTHHRKKVMIHGNSITFKAIIKTLIGIVNGKVEDASDDGLLDHVLEPSSIGGRAR
jgi:hypothetical protein